MAPPISKETAQDLKNVVDMVKKIDVDYKKCEPQYRKVEADLQEAIDDKSEDELELFRPQMEAVLKDVDRCVHSIKGALGLLGNLRKDEALMASKTEQINALVKGLVNKQQELVAHAAKGRAMVLDKAQKALEEAKTSAETAESNLSELKNTHEGIKKAVVYMEGQAKTLDAQTLKAQAAGDARAMSAARVKFLELGYSDQSVGAQALMAKVKKQLPSFKDSKQRAEAQWILDDLPDLIERCRALSKRGQELALLKIAAKPAAPAPAPVKFGNAEVQKILEAFGLNADDAALRAKAMKILNSCPIDEWPKELAKLYKAKESDLKAKLNNVRKLPAVKPLTLIDI